MLGNISTESVDLRARRTRKYLIEALFALVQDKPLQKITVRDITEEAMVNRSTFYAHFVDKFDLFTTAIGQRMRHDLAIEVDESTGFNYSNLHGLILVGGNLMTKILDDCQQSSMDELLPMIMKEMQNSIHEVVSLWATALTMSKAEARALAMFTTGVVFGAVSLWGQQTDDKQRIDEVADQIMPLLMDGITPYTNLSCSPSAEPRR